MNYCGNDMSCRNPPAPQDAGDRESPTPEFASYDWHGKLHHAQSLRAFLHKKYLKKEL